MEGRAVNPLEQKFRAFLLFRKYLVRCLRAVHPARFLPSDELSTGQDNVQEGQGIADLGTSGMGHVTWSFRLFRCCPRSRGHV